MATHKSAEKRHRQSLKRRVRNRNIKTSVRTAVKTTRSAIQGGDKAAALAELRKAEGLMASAATKGIYHKRNASRRISRLAQAVAKLG